MFIINFVLLLFLPAITGVNVTKESQNIYTNDWDNTIEDGWYRSRVKYYNYSTSYSATYTLDINVQDDRVTKLSFPEGGSLHTGYNNEGYVYSGGYLDFDKDYSGNITEASTKVTVYDNEMNMHTFNISIN